MVFGVRQHLAGVVDQLLGPGQGFLEGPEDLLGGGEAIFQVFGATVHFPTLLRARGEARAGFVLRYIGTGPPPRGVAIPGCLQAGAKCN